MCLLIRIRLMQEIVTYRVIGILSILIKLLIYTLTIKELFINKKKKKGHLERSYSFICYQHLTGHKLLSTIHLIKYQLSAKYFLIIFD